MRILRITTALSLFSLAPNMAFALSCSGYSSPSACASAFGTTDPRNFGATCGGATWSAISKRPVQNVAGDDTAAFEAAAAISVASGTALMVPDGCWVSNLIVPSGTVMVGQNLAPNYGYDTTSSNGKPFSGPILYIIGAPAFGINLNGAENLAFANFEVNAVSNGGAFGSTSCIGSTVGSAGFGAKVWLYQMSLKGCSYGYQPSGGLVYTVSQNTDYGANNTGISGTFSDFLSDGDTFVSGSTGIEFNAGNGGFSRVTNGRFEFLTNAITATGSGTTAGALELNISGTQFDHLDRCAISLANRWANVTMTGGGLKSGGVAGSFAITGAADNGAGLIRLTVTSAYTSIHGGSTATGGIVTGDIITIAGVAGTTEANGTWTLTKVDGTHIDLQGTTFSNAYTSGGYGGVNNKDSDICLSGTSGSIGLTLDNVGYYSSSALGQSPAPAYIIDASTSGANNDYININGGTLNKIGTVTVNYNSYTIDVAKWQVSTPPHLRIWATGVDPFINDNNKFSITANGVGIATNTANVGASLDIGTATDSILPPSGTTAQRPSSPIAGMFRYNSDDSNPEFYYASKWNPVNASPIIPFYIGGLTLSNDVGTPNTIVDIAPGGAASDDSTAMITLSSAYTKTTGAWVVGSGNGCLDTGSVANSTWYHLFLIKNVGTGVVDILCSTSATAPTYPSGYTIKRRIGSIKTDTSAHILPFTQIGSVFWWSAATLDVNINNLSTSGLLETLNVPLGVKVSPICRYTMSKDGAAVILTSPDVTDVAPSASNPMSAIPGADAIDTTIAAGVVNTTCPLLTTNTSSQIRARSTGSSTTLSIITTGWVD